MNFGTSDWHPLWTPAGDRVTFMSDRAGAWNLYSQAVNGTGPAERLTTSQYTHRPGSWSPDGKTLLFQEERPSGYDVWMLSMEGERTAQPLLQESFTERSPRFSPDGQWFAYVSNETGQDEIYVRRFPGLGDKIPVSTGGGIAPIWNPDGSELFYRSGARMMAVPVKQKDPLTFGAPTTLFSQDQSIGRSARLFSLASYDVTPDGQRFVMVDGSASAPPTTQLNLVLNWFDELRRLVPTE
jgi:Tol biopolymer transport system component